jgi:hypothetical protein
MVLTIIKIIKLRRIMTIDLSQLHLDWGSSRYKGKVYRSYSLARPLWVDGKNKKETIIKLGKLSDTQMLTTLEITQKYMQRLILKCNDSRFKTNTFYVQANLLSGGILRQLDAFGQAIRQFYDRSRQT